MSDVSDIGDLLNKASTELRRAKRIGTAKAAIAATCTLLGTALGLGWAAHAYLGQLATKDDVAKLVEGNEARMRAIDAINAQQDRRIDKVEIVAATAEGDSIENRRNITGILGGTMLPMRK